MYKPFNNFCLSISTESKPAKQTGGQPHWKRSRVRLLSVSHFTSDFSASVLVANLFYGIETKTFSMLALCDNIQLINGAPLGLGKNILLNRLLNHGKNVEKQAKHLLFARLRRFHKVNI